MTDKEMPIQLTATPTLISRTIYLKSYLSVSHYFLRFISHHAYYYDTTCVGKLCVKADTFQRHR